MTHSPVLSLDAHYYTDQQVFKSETEGLFLKTWQFAGHQSQLTKTGDYFTFDIAGQSLFCVLGRDGEITTLRGNSALGQILSLLKGLMGQKFA